MSDGRLIVTCDFGTTTFRALVTEVDENGSFEVVGSAEEPAQGFHDGDFVDLGAGAACIARLIGKLEETTDIFVTGFAYNVSGSHLRSVRATAQLPIGPGPRPIRQADLDEARSRASTMAIPFDHQILSVTPVEYAVDRVRGVVDPLGRVGSQLEMQAHLITGSRSVLHNIENAIATAKYKPLGEEIDVLATATALLTPRDRADGVMLIDVGGHATNWAVYRKNALISCGAVGLGGWHLTSDLSHGLRIPRDEAEQVKRTRGVVLRSLVDQVPIDVLFDERRPTETPGLVAAILEPRMEEIFTCVKADYGDPRELALLKGGVVLTGGGSRCKGTVGLCEEVMDLPVRRAHTPASLKGADTLPDGQWATALGLSLWLSHGEGGLHVGEESTGRGGWLGRLRGRFRKAQPAEEMAAEA